jgi:hypothetical protein
MPLSFVIFLYLHVSSLHVSGFYQPIIRGIPTSKQPTDVDARGQTAEYYMNQVVTNKQQLGIPLMMGW